MVYGVYASFTQLIQTILKLTRVSCVRTMFVFACFFFFFSICACIYVCVHPVRICHVNRELFIGLPHSWTDSCMNHEMFW